MLCVGYSIQRTKIHKNVHQQIHILFPKKNSQLFYDGHHNIAVELGTIVRADPPCPPSDKLLHAVVQGLAIQDQSKENMNIYKEHVFCGIDLEFETEGTSIAPEPASYETGK